MPRIRGIRVSLDRLATMAPLPVQLPVLLSVFHLLRIAEMARMLNGDPPLPTAAGHNEVALRPLRLHRGGLHHSSGEPPSRVDVPDVMVSRILSLFNQRLAM